MQIADRPNKIDDLRLVDLRVFQDHRGRFFKYFGGQIDEKTLNVSQVNYSETTGVGTTRGLHFQRKPYAEKKIVTCVSGEIFDVIVDLRSDSETFLNWAGYLLSPEIQRAIIIPKGCAHGFQALTEKVSILYLHSESYSPSSDDGVRYNDPRLAIDWPLIPLNLSLRDQTFLLIDDLNWRPF